METAAAAPEEVSGPPKDRIMKEKIPREWPESRTSGGGAPKGGTWFLLSSVFAVAVPCRRISASLRAGRPRRCVPLLTAGQVILPRLLLHQQSSMCCVKKKKKLRDFLSLETTFRVVLSSAVSRVCWLCSSSCAPHHCNSL